jgi:hypothetical protein
MSERVMQRLETIPPTNKPEAGLIHSSTLMLWSFMSAFFPRVLTNLKIPQLINFAHFGLVPFAAGIALFMARPKDQKQLAAVRELLAGLGIFLCVILISALVNNAGLPNIALKFLLLGEPFLFLSAIIILPLSSDRFQSLKTWMNGCIFFHLFLVYVQQFILRLYRLDGGPDNIQGVFFRSGSGHVVGASITASFGLYYFFMTAKTQPLWARVLVLVLSFGNIIFADAKQVIVTLVGGIVILSLTKTDLKKAILYIAGTIIFISIFWWAICNIEALSAFTTWLRPDIYGPNGEATRMKFSGLNITLAHFQSPLNWWFGLGPGHSIDRLGGWMLRDYADLLTPLGATRTTVGEETWSFVAASWLANGSSFFAPWWGWAAIWGDLGFIGLAAYLYLCSIVWRRVCVGDLSKFLMLTVLVHGFIFTQMEEPSYMLYIAALIGLIWQERQVWQQEQRQQMQLMAQMQQIAQLEELEPLQGLNWNRQD